MMNTIQSVSMDFAKFNDSARVRQVTSVTGSLTVEEDANRSRTAEDRSEKIDFSMLSEQDKEKLNEELEKHNSEFSYTGKLLKFKFNEDAKTTYVEVIDSATNEVIVSLPPEFLIDLSIKMKELVGMFIDEKL